jgi:2-methylcitrate dehydratase PrpD
LVHTIEKDAMTDNSTQKLAAFVANTTWQDIPAAVRHEAKRSLLNYFACAIAGSKEPVIENNLTTLARFSGPSTCSLIGRMEQVDMLLASYLNAMIANVFDFDDTHQDTVIHPTAPVAPGLFAHAEVHGCDGKSLLKAFVLGGEIECRIGNSVSPSHYSNGWHITSTCGTFGAAAGIGALLLQDQERLVWAFGNAAAQTAGIVETLGTMSKSVGVGNAARNGVLSALLARNHCAGPADPLTGKNGFVNVFSHSPNPVCLTEGLGEEWEIAKNTYKPYPAGIVLHPVIEACIRLHRDKGIRCQDVAEIELAGHPLLQQRADRPDVGTGRLAQVSAQHAIAVALLYGKAGLAEFSDEAAIRTLREQTRPKVTFIDDDSIPVEAADIIVRTHDGKRHEYAIRAAKGSLENPMTDEDLENKLAELAEFRRFDGNVREIADAIWSLDGAGNAANVMDLVTSRA